MDLQLLRREDGDIVYEYDKNSNKTSILYPAGLEAIYAHDRMDRESSLSIQETGGSPFAIVQSNPAATYRAFGPLASLRFRIHATTNRDEVRSYDMRYAPTRIEARATSGNPPTPFLDWDYTTDAVGNVLAIDDLVESSSWDRSFDYQDWQYFLTEATGPWAGPLAWTYDKAGNRLTETRNSITDDYSYQQNAATTGNTSLLEAIDLAGGGGGTQTYAFDAAGYLEEVELASIPQPFIFDAAGHLAEFGRSLPTSTSYDVQDHLVKVTDGEGTVTSYVYSDRDLMTSQVSEVSGTTTYGWTYDRAGNRLSQTLPTDTYSYAPNAPNAATTGNTSLLEQITPAFSSSHLDYAFDAGGYLSQFEEIDDPTTLTTIDFSFDGAGQASFFDHDTNPDRSLRYDGRGMLSVVADAAGTTVLVESTYSSEGLLHSLLRMPNPHVPSEQIHVLYFAGRPIGIWKKVGTGTATLTRIVTDHLGTPAASILEAGTAMDWYGGFEPFGEDWQAGTGQDSLAKGIFLRMPGQWKDPLWSDATYPMELFYNLHRWYETATGRYASVDPVIALELRRDYQYVVNRPLVLADPLGLAPVPGIPEGGVPCSEISPKPGPGRGCCDVPHAAFSNVIRRRLLYCANSSNDKPVTEMLKARGIGTRGQPVPVPWIVPDPDGNKCVNDCRCFHERYHTTQVRLLRGRPFRPNELECQAYGAQLECLKRKTGFTPVGVSEPQLGNGL